MNTILGKFASIAIVLTILAILIYFFYGVVLSLFEDPSLLTIGGAIFGVAAAAFFVWGVFFRK